AVGSNIADGESFLRRIGPTSAGSEGEASTHRAGDVWRRFRERILLREAGHFGEISNGAERAIVFLRVDLVPPPGLGGPGLTRHQPAPQRPVDPEARRRLDAAFAGEDRLDWLAHRHTWPIAQVRGNVGRRVIVMLIIIALVPDLLVELRTGCNQMM